MASSTFLEQLGASLPPNSDAPAALGEGFAGPAAASVQASLEASGVGAAGVRRWARHHTDTGEAAAEAAAAELHNSLLEPVVRGGRNVCVSVCVRVCVCVCVCAGSIKGGGQSQFLEGRVRYETVNR